MTVLHQTIDISLMGSLVNTFLASFSPLTSPLTNCNMYRKTSNISSTLVGNKIVDYSDVVGAAPVGAAPTTSSFST